MSGRFAANRIAATTGSARAAGRRRAASSGGAGAREAVGYGGGHRALGRRAQVAALRMHTPMMNAKE